MANAKGQCFPDTPQADALHLVRELGPDSPFLRSALAALKVDPDRYIPKPAEPEPLEEQSFQTAPFVNAIPEANSQRKTAWSFPLSFISQVTLAKDSDEVLKPLQEGPQLKIEYCKTQNTGFAIRYNQDNRLEANNDNLAYQPQQLPRYLLPLLQQNHACKGLNLKAAPLHLAQRKPFDTLPKQQKVTQGQNLVIYIFHDDTARPLYRDISHWLQNIQRLIGKHNIAKVVEILAWRGLWRYRSDSTQSLLSPSFNSDIPLPETSQQALFLADPAQCQNILAQRWLAMLKQRCSQRILMAFRPCQNWHYWPDLSLTTHKSNHVVLQQKHTEQIQNLEVLKAIVSTTPGRITMAMVRALRKQLNLGGPDLELDLYNDPAIGWAADTDNGYWHGAVKDYQQQFAQLLFETRIQAARIIQQHLPIGTKSYCHEHQLVTAAYCPEWQQQNSDAINEAAQFFRQAANSMQQAAPEQEALQGYLYHAESRFGDSLNHLPSEIEKPIKQAITLSHYQLKQCYTDIKPSDAIDPETYAALEGKNTEEPQIPGQLRQIGQQLQVQTSEHWPTLDESILNPSAEGVKFAQLSDISRALYTSEQQQSQTLEGIQKGIIPSIGPSQLITPQQTINLQTLNSIDFYWAEQVTVNEQGLTATTAEGIQVQWPALTDAPQQYQAKPMITVPDSCPKWLQQNPPQWDQYGLFTTLNIKGQSLTLRYIPPGSFLMGSPEDEPERFERELQHLVTLSQGFWLGETTVTQALWQAVMAPIGKKNPSDFKDTDDMGLPVDSVTWDESQQFCREIRESFALDLDLTLPSEAQWEYACRAGTQTPFNTGEQLSTEQGNYNGYSPYNNGPKGELRAKAVPVDSFKANSWGLKQMHGNVREWCLDVYQDYNPELSLDPVVLAGFSPAEQGDKPYRVLRGGGWIVSGQGCRSAFRYWGRPAGRYGSTGLRVAASSPCPSGNANEGQAAAPLSEWLR